MPVKYGGRKIAISLTIIEIAIVFVICFFVNLKCKKMAHHFPVMGTGGEMKWEGPKCSKSKTCGTESRRRRAARRFSPHIKTKKSD